MEIEQQIRIDQQDRCYKMFVDAIEKASPKLRYMDTDKVSLYAPKICIDYLIGYCGRFMSQPLNKTVTFMGYKVKVSYMPEVVLVHEDYPLFKNEDLISRVSF
jgi:hypothetical protein